ncbi:hypothetical protein ABVG11_00815 [Streptomyces sp. HD1123-B1]|uniref:hypothetical protein n=1 Tax=Streptomyces huangiella TaxID=3228804 RepID=UPI003D7E51B4
MKKNRSGLAVLVCAVMMLAASGCRDQGLAVPQKFCHAPVKKSSLSPLLPDGESLKLTYSASGGGPAYCDVQVDGHLILSAMVARWDRKPGPATGEEVGSPHEDAAKREVSFPGYASFGSSIAIVRAKCDSASASRYVSVVLDFYGERVDESPTGYKKLLRFVNDLVPGLTKNFHCTK